MLAERTRASLGQPVIIENVSGAAGSLGVGRVARAAADGYTLSLGIWSTHVVNGAVFALSYDVLNDFEPVALLTTVPLLLVASRAVPADNLKGLIAWLGGNPGKASWGTQGTGGPSHSTTSHSRLYLSLTTSSPAMIRFSTRLTRSCSVGKIRPPVAFAQSDFEKPTALTIVRRAPRLTSSCSHQRISSQLNVPGGGVQCGRI